MSPGLEELRRELEPYGLRVLREEIILGERIVDYIGALTLTPAPPTPSLLCHAPRPRAIWRLARSTR